MSRYAELAKTLPTRCAENEAKARLEGLVGSLPDKGDADALRLILDVCNTYQMTIRAVHTHAVLPSKDSLARVGEMTQVVLRDPTAEEIEAAIATADAN